jgi:hypothetical protein
VRVTKSSSVTKKLSLSIELSPDVAFCLLRCFSASIILLPTVAVSFALKGEKKEGGVVNRDRGYAVRLSSATVAAPMSILTFPSRLRTKDVYVCNKNDK